MEPALSNSVGSEQSLHVTIEHNEAQGREDVGMGKKSRRVKKMKRIKTMVVLNGPVGTDRGAERINDSQACHCR
jgi:hypothetical protein